MFTHRQLVRPSRLGARMHLRRRGRRGQDPVEDLRECCRASTAADKALGEAIQGAVAAGTPWREIGRVLGVAEAAGSGQDVINALARSKRDLWRRLWGAGGSDA
ncbi:hypothetical protein [Arthrobacter sp. UYCu712]|uniref:hypothetical protein n=1 Tax=Arthrobacter sp. UYCu712 TaxID=3156340 RepID=UPI0033943ED9